MVLDSRAYNARSVNLMPTMLGPLVSNLLTELATHLQWRMDGTYSAVPRAQAALVNLPVNI